MTDERHIVVIEDSSDDHMVVIEHGIKTVDVFGGTANDRLVVVEQESKTVDVVGGDKRIEISMTTAVGGGSTGSSNVVGGVPVVFDGLQAGDVLSYNGTAIANRRQVDLTDGGNF